VRVAWRQLLLPLMLSQEGKSVVQQLVLIAWVESTRDGIMMSKKLQHEIEKWST